jgi:nucleoside 2-deoxyribosyltransferase
MKIYVIGALRNPAIPQFANELTELGFEVFADWYAAGPDADDYLRDYAKARGWDYKQTLQSHAAVNIFKFDKDHLDQSDIAILLMPAGKSGHLELGYVRGKGKLAFILFDKTPERVDIMYQFADEIFFTKQELFERLKPLA